MVLNKIKYCLILYTKNNFIKNLSRNLSTPSSSYKLIELGIMKPMKAEGTYETGQIFLHRLFGYRGIILFPWCARVFDRSDSLQPNLINSNKKEDKDKNKNNNKTVEVKTKNQTYYQVLIDNRDVPYIKAQNEAVTFLGNQDANRTLYAVPGLDYVSSEDVLPYTSTEKNPIHHELFEKFLMPDPDTESGYSSRESLKAWQNRNHQWLALSDVCVDVTQNIRVTVIPFYMGSRENQTQSTYWWRYSIRIENLGNEPVILRERHWRIFSLFGNLEIVRGKGVVGKEPCLNKDFPAFQYSSHVSLQATSGHMWGTFKMEKEDGSFFEVRIPPFNLESKDDDQTPPSV